MIIDPYTWHRLPIQHIARLTPDTISVRVPRPDGYMYRAGQYAVVRASPAGAPVLRQYSIASSPDNDFLEFLVQREPSGVVSSWFFETAETGTALEISQALGTFTVMNEQVPLLFIAGRVGIAPFLSMFRTEAPADSTLLYSARGADDFCYRELLEQQNTVFFDTETGARINTDVLERHLRPATRVYLCGSKQFVDSLVRKLLDLGVPPGHIRRELFTLQ